MKSLFNLFNHLSLKLINQYVKNKYYFSLIFTFTLSYQHSSLLTDTHTYIHIHPMTVDTTTCLYVYVVGFKDYCVVTLMVLFLHT